MNAAREKFDATFATTSAYALVLDGKNVARVVIKFGAVAKAYVQIWGEDMEVGQASGYGYDKATRAVENAIRKLKQPEHSPGKEVYQMMKDAIEVETLNWAAVLELKGVTVAAVM